MTRTRSSNRLLAAIAAGLAVGVAVAAVSSWQQALLAGWLVVAAVYLVTVWSAIASADGARTHSLSMEEDDNRRAAEIVVIVASTASLAAAWLALREGASTGLTLSAIGTVVASWLVINTHYTLRYAHLYYKPPVGGVDFPGTEAPAYEDFAYLAFTIGMTYQVSDTGLLGAPFRRVLLAHALLSYVFGAVIIATVINVIAGLVR